MFVKGVATTDGAFEVCTIGIGTTSDEYGDIIVTVHLGAGTNYDEFDFMFLLCSSQIRLMAAGDWASCEKWAPRAHSVTYWRLIEGALNECRSKAVLAPPPPDGKVTGMSYSD